jgi:hypothetical protein
MPDADLHFFDAQRGYALFHHDAYVGEPQWNTPSSATLGAAVLYGYRVTTIENGDRAGEQVVVETALGTVRSYLVPWPGETEANFARRRSLAVYVNLVEPIVDAYVDAIVPRVTRDLGDAGTSLRNLDGDGQDWSELVSDVAITAALDGVTACVIDAPTTNPATNRAEEVALGIGLRATVVPLASWAWMRTDDDGRVSEFAYVDAPAVDDTAVNQCVRVYVWNANGCAVYEHELATGAKLAEARDTIVGGRPARAPMALNPLLGGRLPIVFAYHRRVRGRVPRGKSLAASAAAIGRQVYQVLSSVEDTQRRAPPFLNVPTSAKGGLEPQKVARLGPDAALDGPAEGGAPSWVTFPSESLADQRAHAVFLVGLAFRTAGLEVQADTSAQVQSGEALRVRSRDFESRARKFATNLAAFERKALDIAALLLGARRETLTVTYPARYVVADPAEMLAAVMLLEQSFGARLGPEGVREMVRQALDAALSLDEPTLTRLLDEIRPAAPPATGA